MPGNREAYENAMNAGHNAAWDLEWMSAVAAYGRAVQEFPEDPEAHIHLGLALLELGRLEDALKVYNRAHHLAPNDPIPLEKSADVLERMGRLREAATQYINVSEVYLGQRDLDKAIGNWERATRLTPGLIPIHAKLAQAYERIGDKKKAIREYLTLAFNFKRVNDVEKAIKSTQRALRLDKNNPQVLNTLRALETGGDILPPSDEATGVPARSASFDRDNKTGKRATQSRSAVTIETGESDPLGPMGEAMTHSLNLLATFIMEGNAMEVASDALAGMEAHRQGDYDRAILSYQKAEPKMRHPALKMNIGALLMLRDRSADAIKPLMEVVGHPQLGAGALHALGQAAFKTGRQREACRYLIQSLQTVDTNLTVDADEAAELTSTYRELLNALNTVNDEVLSNINRRFIELLQGKDWKQRVADTRRQLSETMEEQGVKGVLDILAAERGDKLSEAVSSIDRYLRRGQLTLAMDEAHHAVEFSPSYLPIHTRMAEIMIREGRMRPAIQKYNVIAKAYLARGENDRAAAILTEVLQMAPLDVSIRESLIDLLETEEKWSDVLDQTIDLADTHHQLGNFDLSRDTYQAAERLSNRTGGAVDKTVRIKHRLADLEQARLDLRRAQKMYEEIIAIAPDDERAHRMLVDMNYRQGNQIEAIRRLDKLLSVYARNKQINRITQLLEELVTLYPNDMGLRSRLAQIYKQLGKSRESIVQLDALGELQLEAGLHKEAANTIRQIVTLNPENVEDYRKLLGQLGGWRGADTRVDLRYFLTSLTAGDVLDILLVACVFFTLSFFVRGTQAMALLRGLVLLFGAAVLVSSLFDLVAVRWLLERGLTVLFIAVPVIFQPELRRLLERLGRAGFLVSRGAPDTLRARIIEDVTQAAERLSERRHGALIVLERSSGLQEYIRTGIPLNGDVSPQLLLTIFWPKTELHDGAAIVNRHGKLASAASVLPLSSARNLGQPKLGTRHRAAIGLSEVSDAICIIVSEETGRISIANGGRLIPRLDSKRMRTILSALYGSERAQALTLPQRIREQVSELVIRVRQRKNT